MTRKPTASPVSTKWWKWELMLATDFQCSGLRWKSCRSWSEFWEIQTSICKEMCKKLLVLTKSCWSRTDGPALVSNTVEPLWKGQESLTKVAKIGPFSRTILYKSCLFYPSWQATSFERPPSWVAFIEGFHCIIKTHVRGFFDTDLHEVSWHFATHEAVRPSGF